MKTKLNIKPFTFQETRGEATIDVNFEGCDVEVEYSQDEYKTAVQGMVQLITTIAKEFK